MATHLPPLFLHPWCEPPPGYDQLLHSLDWTSLHQANANRGEQLRSDLPFLKSNTQGFVFKWPLLWALSETRKGLLEKMTKFKRSNHPVVMPWPSKTFLLVITATCKNQLKVPFLLLFLVPLATWNCFLSLLIKIIANIGRGMKGVFWVLIMYCLLI